MENENIPTDKEINDAIAQNKLNNTWEKDIYKVEQLVGDLYSYALLCAMETSKFSGHNRQLAIVAERLKTFADTSRSMLNNFQHNPKSKIKFGYMTTNGDVLSRTELNEIDENLAVKADKIAEDNNVSEGSDLKAEFATIMQFMTGVMESTALKGLIEAYKGEATSLMICLEEIRKSILELRQIFKGDKNNERLLWHSGIYIEAEKMRTNSKKSQYLSFNIGKNEIIEEFSSIVEIFNYKDYIEAIEEVVSGKEPHLQYDSESFIKIDAYLDLHRLMNIDQATDLNDKKILIIKMPTSYKLGTYKNIAVTVDFVNYPLLTGSGDEYPPANQQIKGDFIRVCWHTIQAKIATKSENLEKENGELLFLDWQKILTNQEDLMLKNSTILLVDHDHAVREVIAQVLESEGLIKVVQAISGKAAVELAAKNKFDLIISDLNMPGMDGLETIKKVKELQPTISSMIMTGFGSIDIAIKAFSESKIDDFLAKPIGNEELINKTKSFLTNKPHPGFNSKEADKQ